MVVPQTTFPCVRCRTRSSVSVFAVDVCFVLFALICESAISSACESWRLTVRLSVRTGISSSIERSPATKWARVSTTLRRTRAPLSPMRRKFWRSSSTKCISVCRAGTVMHGVGVLRRTLTLARIAAVTVRPTMAELKRDCGDVKRAQTSRENAPRLRLCVGGRPATSRKS